LNSSEKQVIDVTDLNTSDNQSESITCEDAILRKQLDLLLEVKEPFDASVTLENIQSLKEVGARHFHNREMPKALESFSKCILGIQ